MNKTINLFISQPMSGLTSDEIQKERDRIADNYCLQCGYNRDDVIVINDIEYNELCSDERHGPLTFLGLAIQRLAIADVVIFHKDWEKARGCKIEHDIVRRYSNDYDWAVLYDYDILGLSDIKPWSKAAIFMMNGRVFDKMHSNDIEDEYYRQVDKALKEDKDETLSSSRESGSETT